VVWFGEMLPAVALAAAEEAAQACDLMLVVGTSGAVYPAAGLAHTARQGGARVVVINPEPTELDSVAHALVRATAAVAMPALLAG
jgi:NAD-dependent deacetylase